MVDLLNIGTSGLLSNQVGITTTGHNIANANVEGYSRQQVLFESQVPQRGAAGFLGSGVITQEVRRISDQFVVNQLRKDIENFSGHDAFVGFATQLESLIANEQAGLSAGLQSLFSAIQVAGEDPASLTARQQVLSESENLATRFNTLYDQILSQSIAVNQQVTLATDQINGLGKSIADLNQKIAVAGGQAGGAAPNDLLDKRDIALNELSKLVSVSTSVQDGNQVNVFVGKGQPLVLGSQSSVLTISNSATRPGEKDVFIAGINVSDDLKGGSLGAMLRVRGDILNPALNTMGQIALGISAELNATQERGVDLFGQPGQPLFADINSEDARLGRALVDANNNDESNGILGITVRDVSRVSTDDYILSFDGPSSDSYALSRASDGVVVSSGTFAGSPSTVSTPEGFDITLESGNFSLGDRVRIEPTRNGARDFQVVLARPEGLAFAQAVRTGAAVHNTGSGDVSQGEVIAVRTPDGSALLPDFSTPGELAPPLLIRFDTPETYRILDNSDPNNPVDLVPAQTGLNFVPGASNSLLPTDPTDPGFRGYTVNINGEPQTGDEFTIEFNSGGVGDSRNALAMADVQSMPVLNGGINSFSDVYNGLVQNVAAQVSQSRVSRDASETLMNQTLNARDSVSGVNLDEEAARLIQLEQAYNASAQVIQVAREIFDTLLSAFR